MSNTDQNNRSDESEEKSAKIWGAIYICLGIIGLVFSAYLLINCGEITPLIGAIIGGVLFGVLSILVIIFGYRVIKRDF